MERLIMKEKQLSQVMFLRSSCHNEMYIAGKTFQNPVLKIKKSRDWFIYLHF